MTLSAVDYASKTEAYAAAADAGYDESSVSVTVDKETWRYQWALRDFSASLADDSNVPSGTDADVTVEDDALDVTLDVVTDIVIPEGWTSVEGGVVTEPVSEGSPFVIAGVDDAPVLHVTGDIADAFGLKGLVDTGLVQADAEPASERFTYVAGYTADGAAIAASAEIPVFVEDANGNAAVGYAPSEPKAEPAPVSGGDLIMQLHGAMPAAPMLQFAQEVADKHMAIVTLRDALTFAVTATFVPGMGKRSSGASRVTGGGSISILSAGASVPRAVVNRPASTIDRIRSEGYWSDLESEGGPPASNSTILTLKHAIEAAAEADDLDALAKLDRKTVSTYYNQAREYRLWHIAAVTKRIAERNAKRAAEQAALDAEFGYALAAD